MKKIIFAFAALLMLSGCANTLPAPDLKSSIQTALAAEACGIASDTLNDAGYRVFAISCLGGGRMSDYVTDLPTRCSKVEATPEIFRASTIRVYVVHCNVNAVPIEIRL